MIPLAGHRSVGGLRASIYNGKKNEKTETLFRTSPKHSNNLIDHFLLEENLRTISFKLKYHAKAIFFRLIKKIPIVSEISTLIKNSLKELIIFLFMN